MIPVAFPEQNVTWAENQPPYLPLPARTIGDRTDSCWALSWPERLRLFVTGRLWISQLNFRDKLQPIKPSTVAP